MPTDDEFEFEFEELDSVALRELGEIEASATPKDAISPKVASKFKPDRAARISQLRQIFNSSDTSVPLASSSTPTASGSTSSPFSIVSRVPGSSYDTAIRVLEDDSAPSHPHMPPPNLDFSDIIDDFEIDEHVLREIDKLENAAYSVPPKLTRQTTLTGEILPEPSKRPFTRTKSKNAFPDSKPPAVTKKWDWAGFAKTGLRPIGQKGKAKQRAAAGEEEEELEIDSEQLLASAVPTGPPPPMRVEPDVPACKEWIFPLNRPKRDYQFNIVRKCLFDNTLVALPTGLGKTFVAGCVTLNYYRWFPQGKIIFLAPTKPLVSQQVTASHEQCGIPGSAAAELTGSLKPESRKPLWESKRVFYMTPQTFVRDLHNGNVDPLDIILIVVDEAHRATGDYAYCTAIRYMMAKNPHFRVLALTATPGSNAEAVQCIVDNMHISHIEIRDENALDLRDYIHRKHMVQHVVPLSPELMKIFDHIVKLMQKIYTPIGQFLPGADMATMGDFRPMAVTRDLTPANRWAIGALRNLGDLARARTYLLTESFEMCYQTLVDLTAVKESAKPTARGGKKKLANDPIFQSLMASINSLKQANGFIVHPKMDKLKAILLEHFSSVSERQTVSKVMVFASYRPVVEQIVGQLNEQEPLIRAHRFIGQSASKDGVKGLTQKEQLQVIERFKKNEVNTLVCTSIGEEGLDIGEVDLIVCYDSHKAPIKMLQRAGRTGRRQDGHIIVLVAEGKEEENFSKAKAAYADVQKAIVNGDQLVLYGDAERLVPDGIRPQVCEKVMPIEPYHGLPGGPLGTKRKRSGGGPRSVPAGRIEGFMTAKSLIKASKGSAPKVKATRKQAKSTLDMNAVSDGESCGETDMDLDAALAARVRPSGSKEATSDHSSEDRPKKKRKPKKGPETSLTAAEPKPNAGLSRHIGAFSEFVSAKKLMKLEDHGRNDISGSQQRPRECLQSPHSDPDIEIISIHQTPNCSLSLPVTPSLQLVQKLADKPLSPLRFSSYSPPFSSSREYSPHIQREPSMEWEDGPPSPIRTEKHWLLDSDDEPQVLPMGLSSRPSPGGSKSLGTGSLSRHNPLSPLVLSTKTSTRVLGSLVNRIVTDMQPPSAVIRKRPRLIDLSTTVDDMDTDESQSVRQMGARTSTRKHRQPGSSPEPLDYCSSLDLSQYHVPSQKKRAFVKGRKRSPSPIFSLHLEPEDSSLESRGLPPAPTSNRGKIKTRRSSRRRDQQPFWDHQNDLVEIEATHSGDEISGGFSSSDGQHEDEYDREFIADESRLTQVDSSYDQSAIYRQGLFTQAPRASLAFHNRPVRGGAFGPADRRLNERWNGGVRVDSSPNASMNRSDDRYSIGSFVVDDEEPVSDVSDE